MIPAVDPARFETTSRGIGHARSSVAYTPGASVVAMAPPNDDPPADTDSSDGLTGRLRALVERAAERLGEDPDIETPGDWQLSRRGEERTVWVQPTTEQLVICERKRKGAWITRAKPAIIDEEEVDLSLTAGPTSRAIAEYLAIQFMAHQLVLAPITAMQPRH